MIGVGNNNPKLRGVQAPPGRNEVGAPRTILTVGKPLELYPVQFNDENGTTRISIAVKVGDQLYFPPNGIEWAASLAPAAEWFKKEWKTKGPALMAEEPTPHNLPKEDVVDVLGTGGKDEAPPAA
jgi:hypothetical protein